QHPTWAPLAADDRLIALAELLRGVQRLLPELAEAPRRLVAPLDLVGVDLLVAGAGRVAPPVLDEEAEPGRHAKDLVEQALLERGVGDDQRRDVERLVDLPAQQWVVDRRQDRPEL